MAYTDSQWTELLSGVTSGTSAPQPCNTAAQISWEVEWSSGVTSGQVKIEHSSSASFSGTWAELDSQNASAGSRQLGTFPGPLEFVRARVSSNVAGGTVTVRLKRLYQG